MLFIVLLKEENAVLAWIEHFMQVLLAVYRLFDYILHFVWSWAQILTLLLALFLLLLSPFHQIFFVSPYWNQAMLRTLLALIILTIFNLGKVDLLLKYVGLRLSSVRDRIFCFRQASLKILVQFLLFQVNNLTARCCFRDWLDWYECVRFEWMSDTLKKLWALELKLFPLKIVLALLLQSIHILINLFSSLLHRNLLLNPLVYLRNGLTPWLLLLLLHFFPFFPYWLVF